MIASLVLVVAALIVPTILALGALFLLGSVVVALADGAVQNGGLRRPGV
jgi:hypothetical protein